MARLMLPDSPQEPSYVFLVLENNLNKSEEDYRHFRREFLAAHCQVAKYMHPQVDDFIGIAVDHPNHVGSSEDLIYLDTSGWTDDENQHAAKLQKDFEIFVDVEEKSMSDQEYPELYTARRKVVGPEPPNRKVKVGRNELCPCGSGKKYKRCCLR